jgi:hypothetical protein
MSVIESVQLPVLAGGSCVCPMVDVWKTIWFVTEFKTASMLLMKTKVSFVKLNQYKVNIHNENITKIVMQKQD